MDVGSVLFGLVVVAFGALTTREAVLTWRGRELRRVGEWLRHPDQGAGARLGGRTLYQTFLGGGLAFVPGGPALLVLGAGIVGLGVTGVDDDPWWWWAASLVGVALGALACLYSVAYFTVGVPDGLRPEAQRGQPRPGQVDADGRPHPFDRLVRAAGPVDLGPDPTRPPWARGDPEWTGYRRRPRPDGAW